MKLFEMFNKPVDEMKSGKPRAPRGINIKTNVDALGRGWVDQQQGGRQKQQNETDVRDAVEAAGLMHGFDFIVKRGKDGKVVVHLTGKVDKAKVQAAKEALKQFQDVTEGPQPGQIRTTKIKHGHKYQPHKHKNKKALNKWQGKDDLDEAGNTPAEIAADLLAKVERNENNVQSKMADSPEPIRTLMYTLLPNAERIDGSKAYHDIIDHMEAIWSGQPVQVTLDEDEATAVTAEQVRDAWMAEFPNSSVNVRKAFGGGTTFSFHLVKDKSEVSSGIMDNDPFNYAALLDENGDWKEWRTYMHVAPPEGSHLVYGSEKFRKKSAKNVTLQQIQKRFKQVKQFVAQNADKLHRIHFDIGEKLGTTVNEAGYTRPVKTLQKELIVYPNATYDRGQAVRLPVGMEVDFAQGGDDWRNNRAKITADNKVWFAWNDDYLKAIMEPRKVKEGDAEGQQFGVYPTGGSIGRASPKPYKTFDNKPDAQAHARRMRKQLTPGEKGYYKMGYVVKPVDAIAEDEGDGNQHLYMVRCIGNFWGGKYYETGIDSIVVAASSSDEAVQLANSNIDAVIEHFHNKRIGARKRPALRRNDNTVRATDTVKELSQTEFHKVLSSNGTFGPINVAEGLAEDEGDIKSKDPKVSQMLKKARINYAGRADDDLSALVSMMGDEQDVQDNELNSLDHHNSSQDVEIDHEEHTNVDQEEEIMDLQSRVNKLEKEHAQKMEGINEEQLDEGILQDVVNFLWNATGKVLDNLPVIGDKRAEQRILDEYEAFVAKMDDATIDAWVNELLAKFKSKHPATTKASARRVDMLRKAIVKTKSSKDSFDYLQNMRAVRRALTGLNKFTKQSNKGVMDRRRQVRPTESVNEVGIGKAVKKGVKNIKRGMQGWSKSSGNNPQKISRKVQDLDDTSLERADSFHHHMGSDPSGHTPHDLAGRLTTREKRRRGKGDFKKYMNEAEHSEAVNQVLMRLQAAGGSVYKKAILQKGDETAMLAQNGNIRFAIFQDGKVKRAKKFIEFQRDGWEIEMNLGEAIVHDSGEYYDDETGLVYKKDEIEKGEDGKYREKPYASEPDDESLEQWKDNYNKGYEDEPDGESLTTTWAEVQAKKKGGGHQAQAVGMFGDIAAGGGDPVDHLMTELGMSMEQIDVLAKDNGYDDAYEWAESYQMHESIISSFKKLDKR